MELLILSEEKLIILLQVMNNSDEINYFFKNNYQNKIGIETCIRNMRDTGELQKSNVLKVEELSRRKLTEDFEKATSFFQGSDVKTIYIHPWRQRREVPRC